MSIRVTFLGQTSGRCALSGKEDGECVQVAFEGEGPVLLTKKSFWQLLAMRLSQVKQPEPKPAPKPEVPRATPALPQNGPAVVQK